MRAAQGRTDTGLRQIPVALLDNALFHLVHLQSSIRPVRLDDVDDVGKADGLAVHRLHTHGLRAEGNGNIMAHHRLMRRLKPLVPNPSQHGLEAHRIWTRHLSNAKDKAALARLAGCLGQTVLQPFDITAPAYLEREGQTRE